MSLAEDNLRLTTLKAIVDAANDEMAQLRKAHTTQLVDRYEEEGNSSWKVKLPDGTVVASVNLKVPKKAAKVTDEEAFMAWVESAHPDAIQVDVIPEVPEQIIPAQPAQEVKSVSGKRLAELEKHFDLTADGVVDTATGSVVDGMVVVPAAKPSSFEVRFETTGGGGRQDLAAAYRAGQLNHVVAGSALPQVAAPVERRLEPVPSPEEVDPDDLGPEYSDGYQLPGEREPLTVVGETVANVMDEDPGLCGADCTGCSICDPDGDYSRFEGDGDQEWRAQPVSPARAALEEHADELLARYSAAPADDFDPGDFGTTSTGTGGW